MTLVEFYLILVSKTWLWLKRFLALLWQELDIDGLRQLIKLEQITFKV